MHALTKWLILSHRYLGIPLSLLFVMWFVTGIAMIWARAMPRLTPDVRLTHLDDLDIAQVRLTPADAFARTEMTAAPYEAALLTVTGRPAYRFGRTTVFADTGELLQEIDRAEALTVAARFMRLPQEQLQYAGLITSPDQWTLGQGRQLPLHKIFVDDPDRTELYISEQTGEVTQLTTRRSRVLAWIGAIPHWLYFTSLRLNQPLWYEIVVWASGLGCILAILGLVLGFTQLKVTRPLRLSRVASYLPYSGWMRWHYITGLVFGVFTLTWVFSGLLSMEPWEWTRRESIGAELNEGLSGGPLELARFPAMGQAVWSQLSPERAIKEITLTRIQGDPYYVASRAPQQSGAPDQRGHQPYAVTRGNESIELLVAADTLQPRRELFSVESLMTRVRETYPDIGVAESSLLTEYDSYYYSRESAAPLPVLRVKFEDPEDTWVYIDATRSQLVARIHRMERVERWLYSGLHNLDFAFLYYSEPLWSVTVIVLSLGGLASSGIGMFLGVKRLRRSAVRVAKSPAPVGEALPAARTFQEGSNMS